MLGIFYIITKNETIFKKEFMNPCINIKAIKSEINNIEEEFIIIHKEIKRELFNNNTEYVKKLIEKNINDWNETYINKELKPTNKPDWWTSKHNNISETFFKNFLNKYIINNTYIPKTKFPINAYLINDSNIESLENSYVIHLYNSKIMDICSNTYIMTIFNTMICDMKNKSEINIAGGTSTILTLSPP